MRHGGGIQYAVERVGQIGESLETGRSFEIGCDFTGNDFMGNDGVV